MSLVRIGRRTALAVAAFALGACGDSTAPTIDNIDTQGLAAQVEPVLAIMNQPAVASFGSLGTVDGIPASASAATLSAIARLTESSARGRWDAPVPQLSRSAAAAADVIPPEARGSRFVYNPETGSYEVAADPAGAPANGIRIMLYAWNALAGEPSSPLTVIGHVDLIDESNAQQDRLHVELVRSSDNLELMDYAITHSLTTSSESFSIAGGLTNGTTAVTFDLSGTVTETSATAAFELEVPSLGFRVAQNVSMNTLTEAATVGVELEHGGHTLTFSVVVEPNSIEGEIRYDGRRYAEFTMTFDAEGSVVTTTFTKANGRPMTIEEIEAIGNLFERALDFDDFWAGLLWPVGALAPAV